MATDRAPSIADLASIQFHLPTPEESRAASRAWYEAVGSTFLDRYPRALSALAPKTTLLEFPKELVDVFYDEQRSGFPSEFRHLSDMIDEACGWSDHFVRLNSRSPKDASFPAMPFACCGRQALLMIRCSERCLDDLVRFQYSDAPAYVALRERVFIRPLHEFRCFVRKGRLIAAAQYARGLEEHVDNPTRSVIEASTWDFVEATVLPALHLPDVVVDICWDGSGPRLLEINPYGLSDPVAALSYDAIEAEPGRFFWYAVSSNDPERAFHL